MMNTVTQRALQGLCALFLAGQVANARDLVLVAPRGAQGALVELLATYERQSGQHVEAAYLTGGAARNRALHGEDVDIAILQPPYEAVLAAGHVRPASETKIASVPVAVAVRAGAKLPDISTGEAVKRLLLSISSVAYPDPARGTGAGISFEHTLEQLGIAAEVHAKRKHADGGFEAMKMVAEGQVELGLTYQSEMLEPGIRIVGPLPQQISPPTPLMGYVSVECADAEGAQAVLRFLASPAARAVYQAHSMQPIY
jgi:molybdate transport system substrate-binding protein